MDNQRLILFIALAAVLLMLWQAWQAQYAPRPVPTSAIDSTSQGGVNSVPTAPDVPSQLQQETVVAPVAPAATGLRSGRQIKVVTDVLDVVIDTQGGDLRSLKLLKHPIEAHKPDQPFQLLSPEPDTLFVAQSGLVGRDGTYPSHETIYRSDRSEYQLKPDQNTLQVKLHWRAADGLRFTKIYSFQRNSYLIEVKHQFENTSSKVRQAHQYGQLRRHQVVSDTGIFRLPTYVGGAIYTPEEKYEKIDFSEMADKPLKRDAKGGWVAIMQHYFVGSWMPAPESRNRFYTRDLGANNFIIGFTSVEPVSVQPGQSAELSTQLYVGPKEQDRLKNLAEGMDLTVDYGWLTVLSAPLYWLLSEIHDWVGNWGWSIIILTLIIKLVFFPLSATSYKSMAHMRRVQPKLASIKERYGDDKQRYNQAMMEIYKKEKINPLGGCLPILIQIPVFIALYWVLLESIEMRHAPFALWIQDLSSPDPYFVLPLIMGVSMYAQHWLNPSPVDPIQKKIMQFMPAMFTVFFLFFPAGLVLYWVVNNILSIAQQWQITRMVEAKAK